ncbi:MAG TPA: hypothetical protein VFL04_09020 [Rectinemataceae bacterium]|nr:hypothetical protein [Rectinemataceae bacterium]
MNRDAGSARTRGGTEAALRITAIRTWYRHSETGAAMAAVGGMREHRRPAAIPHHMRASTRGAASIEASIPTGWKPPKVKMRIGATAAWAPREAARALEMMGGR